MAKKKKKKDNKIKVSGAFLVVILKSHGKYLIFMDKPREKLHTIGPSQSKETWGTSSRPFIPQLFEYFLCASVVLGVGDSADENAGDGKRRETGL